MRMSRRNDRAEMFSFRGHDPETAWTRDIKVSRLVDLDSVEGVFARRARHVETMIPPPLLCQEPLSSI